jgi:hypothetical protein
MMKRQKKVELRLALIAVFITGWLAALYTVHAQAPEFHTAAFLYLDHSGPSVYSTPDVINPQQKGKESYSSFKASPYESRTAQKHHKRTIVTPAIIADFSVPSPQFFYCDVAYTLFLPGGCSRQPVPHFSLRGPPSFC